MDIQLVAPPPADLTNGNRVTALRWAEILRELGHAAEVRHEYDGEACDLLVVLHAIKCFNAAAEFRKRFPDRPLIVALTGTDVYGAASIEPALHRATRIVVLQRHALTLVPEQHRDRAAVIYQSCAAPQTSTSKPSDRFQVAVVGHLRAVKDPFRAAEAVRDLPSDSHIAVRHAGRALTEPMEKRARAEMRDNPRYEWLGDIPRDSAHQLIAASHLLAITSLAEGSSNVLSEALACGVPIVASQVDGLVGTLGDDYPGLFPVGDTGALRALLLRAETDAAFYDRLRAEGAELATLASPARERAAWAELLQGLG